MVCANMSSFVLLCFCLSFRFVSLDAFFFFFLDVSLLLLLQFEIERLIRVCHVLLKLIYNLLKPNFDIFTQNELSSINECITEMNETYDVTKMDKTHDVTKVDETHDATEMEGEHMMPQRWRVNT